MRSVYAQVILKAAFNPHANDIFNMHGLLSGHRKNNLLQGANIIAK